MNFDRLKEKLTILADAAKYDVSCSSSGSNRTNHNKGLGNASMGICHAHTQDGRCVSLLKILLTNHCIFDCAYCINRKSSDTKRAGFTVDEVVDLTINFYRRNYIEGLFLSSGIFKSADHTMERLVLVAKKLRTEHKFNGYIHLKTIPGASDMLIKEAGLYADRLSVNIEMPTEKSLTLLAPEKKMQDVITPMKYLSESILQHKEEKKVFKKAPVFAPAGQSTQMVIGATPETDFQILHMANGFYKKMNLKRVYYSGYIPVSHDNRLPAIGTPVPMIREHRLYQADWLMRFYHFKAEEIVTPDHPLLEMEIDPKLQWALQNLHLFPIDINAADYHMILRIPGIGIQSAQKICAARKHAKLSLEHLKNLGVQISRAKYFIVCQGKIETRELQPQQIRQHILALGKSKYEPNFSPQLSLFG
jgi:putative DNA modification/repair radical SAM protein